MPKMSIRFTRASGHFATLVSARDGLIAVTRAVEACLALMACLIGGMPKRHLRTLLSTASLTTRVGYLQATIEDIGLLAEAGSSVLALVNTKLTPDALEQMTSSDPTRRHLVALNNAIGKGNFRMDITIDGQFLVIEHLARSSGTQKDAAWSGTFDVPTDVFKTKLKRVIGTVAGSGRVEIDFAMAPRDFEKITKAGFPYIRVKGRGYRNASQIRIQKIVTWKGLSHEDLPDALKLKDIVTS